jgi:SSS family solute:Na+ symporter
MVLAFWSSVAAVFVYLVISLLQRRLFNLDQMLHRGKYAVAEDVIDADQTKVRGWRALIGFTREFSRADKWVYSLAVAWMLLQVGVFIIGTIIGLVVGLDDSVWLAYWRVHLGAFYIISVITVVWFSIAGTQDLVDMFRRLASARRDNSDDGIVGNLQMQSDPQPQEVQVK